MDSQARIATYMEALRFEYGATATRAADLNGLRGKIRALREEAESGIGITSSAFEGEQSAAQILLEPMEKLEAAMAVYRELDPTGAPEQPPAGALSDFSWGWLQT